MARRSNGEKRAFWQWVIQMQAESGLSVRGFCEREGLKQGTFFSWRRKLQREADELPAAGGDAAGDDKEVPRLAPVHLLEDRNSVAVEIVAPNGLIVRVRDDAATENVRRVVGVVQEVA